MTGKKLVSSAFAVFFCTLPFMVFSNFVVLYMLVNIEILSGSFFFLLLVFAVIFYFRCSGYFATRCFSKKGIMEKGGWLYIAVFFVLFFGADFSIDKMVSESGYFLLHTDENPSLPSKSSDYSLAFSDERVCFVESIRIGSRSRQLSKTCYERNQQNMMYGR